MDRFGQGLPDAQAISNPSVGTCAGCGDKVFEDEERLDLGDGRCIHDDWECAYLFVKKLAD